MRLIDRHIFTHWAWAFVASLALTIGLLVLQNVYDTLPDLLGFGASYLQIVSYYATFIPGFFPTIIPLALLISILVAIGRLRKMNEITAMRAGGLSLWRITRSLWIAGLALSALLFYLSSAVIPASVIRAREIWDNLAYNRQLETRASNEVGLLYNLTFYNAADNRLWFINRFSQYTYMAYGVSVSEQDAQGRELRRVIANQAYYDEYLGHWIMEDGRTITFDPGSSEPVRSLPFDKQSMASYVENPTLMQALEKKPNSLSVKELRTLISQLPQDNDTRINGYRVQYHSLLAAPLGCVLVVGIALPFALGGNNRSPMVSASQSIVFFFVYYLVARIFAILGSRGIIDPMIAAWLPIVLTACAIPILYNRKVG